MSKRHDARKGQRTERAGSQRATEPVTGIGARGFISPVKAAEVLDCSRKHVHALRQRGEFLYIRDGRFVRIDRASFERYLQRQTIHGGAE